MSHFYHALGYGMAVAIYKWHASLWRKMLEMGPDYFLVGCGIAGCLCYWVVTS